MKPRNGNNIFKWFLISLGTLLLLGFGLNWFLTVRLENYLRKELSNIIADASGGFYKFSFSDLSVGFFNGELSMSGIVLTPDSLILERWNRVDSIPQLYANVHIEELGFEGINLVWRFNYKQLNFKLLNVISPKIELFGRDKTNEVEYVENREKIKTIYEMISPYINELRVKEIKLENSYVSYIVSDSINKAEYALQDFNFMAQGFLLNSLSATRGKLLYCDNFEFETNGTQVLLEDGIFKLTTEKIRLSTADSLVHIGKTQLIPGNKIEDSDKTTIQNYVEASVDGINIAGVDFIRHNANNYLKADVLRIIYPQVHYHSVKKEINHVKTEVTPDRTSEPWTLYGMIAPIFNSINIKQILVDEARLEYSVHSPYFDDRYTLNKLNFTATNFLVDSLSMIENRMRKKFLYCESYLLDATDIKGKISSQNHNVDIGQMYLNTQSGGFKIRDLKLYPISTNVKTDYVNGQIAEINLNGSAKDKKLYMDRFEVKSPRITYTNFGDKRRSQTKTKFLTTAHIKPFTEYIDGFYIKEFILDNANVMLREKESGLSFLLNNADLFVSNLELNEMTVAYAPFYFNYDGFEFRFHTFDNPTPDGRYDIKIDRGYISSFERLVDLEILSIVPRNKTLENYVGIKADRLKINADLIPLFKGEAIIDIDSLKLIDPQIRLKNAKKISGALSKNDVKSVVNFIPAKLNIKNLCMPNVDIQYTDKRATISYMSDLFLVDSLQINIANGDVAFTLFDAFNVRSEVLQPSRDIVLETDTVKINDLRMTDSDFYLSGFQMYKPKVGISIKNKGENIKNKKKDENAESVYSHLGKFKERINIGQFSVQDAEVNISFLKDGCVYKRYSNPMSISFSQLSIDNKAGIFDIDNFDWNTENINYPLMDGFYTMSVDKASLIKDQDVRFRLDGISLNAKYPKLEYAYKHPKNRDWYDLKIESILLKDIDAPAWFANKELKAAKLEINDGLLQNFKNQKIILPRRISPMVYEKLQNLPITFDIKTVSVNNFTVIYEELAKKGTELGQLALNNMNGLIYGLTNVASSPDQFIRLDANGLLMGSGYFDATWMIPADKNYDRFLLNAHLRNLDLTGLNRMITPLAPARISNGYAQDIFFNIDATSKGATVDMIFPYNNLKIDILNAEDGSRKKIASYLLNKIIKSDNPSARSPSKYREYNLYVERNPYHSTFNYFWQILQPPLAESVGVSKKKQNLAKSISNVVSGIKKLFGRSADSKKNNETDRMDKGSTE